MFISYSKFSLAARLVLPSDESFADFGKLIEKMLTKLTRKKNVDDYNFSGVAYPTYCHSQFSYSCSGHTYRIVQ